MPRLNVFLAEFVLVVSVIGFFLPGSSQISFLFPNLYTAAAGTALSFGFLAWYFTGGQQAKTFSKIYGILGRALLAIMLLKLTWSAAFLNNLSNVDLFVVVPLGLSFTMTWLDDENTKFEFRLLSKFGRSLSAANNYVYKLARQNLPTGSQLTAARLTTLIHLSNLKTWLVTSIATQAKHIQPPPQA